MNSAFLNTMRALSALSLYAVPSDKDIGPNSWSSTSAL